MYNSLENENAKKALKEQAQEIKRRLNEKKPYLEDPYPLYLSGIEENIARWRGEEPSYYYYFLTDLNGNLLLNGDVFQYISPFSNGSAFIRGFHSCFILNSNTHELLVPDYLPGKVRGFVNNNIELRNLQNQKYGSYLLNPDEKTITEDIPFVWDYLAFARDESLYLGVKLPRICSKHDRRTEYLKVIEGAMKDIAYDYESARRIIADIRYGTYRFDIGEEPKEYFRPSDQSLKNDGTIVDLGEMTDYKKVLCKTLPKK